MKMHNSANPRGLTMAHDLPRKPLTLADIKTKRWVKKDNGRILPLNSAAWSKLRRQVLAEEPLCRHCAAQGLVVPATEVDHMNGADDNRRDALQALCKPCHSRKTMAEMYGRPAPMGCDAEGYPIDPTHHWNAAAVGPSGGLAGAVSEQKSPAADGAEPTCSLRAHQST